MRNLDMNRKFESMRAPTYCALLIGVSLLLGSCGAINTILSGDAKGLGDPFEYALTIQYERSGGGIIYADTTVFWVMPLDGDGEVIEDPQNPDGPPLRYELVGGSDSGTVSAVVPYGEYAILAYVDSDGDGALELGESYEIFDNYSMRDGTCERVLVDEAKTVDFVLDALAQWHVVYIYTPRDGSPVSGDFTALFGTLVKDNPNLRVYLNSTEIPRSSFGYDSKTDVWYVPVYEAQLLPSMNYLHVNLYDQGGYLMDYDRVYFSHYP